MTRAQLYALIVTAGILVLFAGGGGRRFAGPPAGTVTDRHEGALGAASSLQASIEQAAGNLRVQTADSAAAYTAVLTHDRRANVTVTYRDGTLRIADDRGARWGVRRAGAWDITLSRRVPVDLRISSGAGGAALDLTGLRGDIRVQAGTGAVGLRLAEGDAAVDELEIQAGTGRFEATGLGHARARRIAVRAGVGQFELDFSGPGRDRTEVDIQGGVGRIAITFPAGVGVRVQGRAGVAGRLTLPGFTQRGEEEHVNVLWDTAPVRLDIRVRVGIGGIQVRER